MQSFVENQEEKLYKALQTLIGNCVNHMGLPKKPTPSQLSKAEHVLLAYDGYERKYHGRI